MIKNMKKNKKGFTLIELIVVIAIIAILAAVAIPNYIAVQKKAEDAVVLGNAKIIVNSINAHNLMVGTTHADYITATADATYAALTADTFSVPLTNITSDEFDAAMALIAVTAGSATIS